jgi:NAD(P)-dependent dehydrogenase (short-subunit alcohol dehydrogenase family)
VFGNAGSSSYGAAKAGVVGFTRIIAQELAPLGARANCVLPFAWTRMAAELPQAGGNGTANRRLQRLQALDPEHVANLVVFLASGAEPRTTGQVLGMRGKELLVLGQPRIDARIVLHDTSPRSLAETLGGRLEAHLEPLRASGEVFDYEPYL